MSAIITIVITKFRSWIPLGVIIFGLCGVVYLGLQQNYRQSAYDPQIQMAEDIGNASSTFVSAASSTQTQTKINISQSLATFTMVFDDTGKLVSSTGILDDQQTMPTVPSGVFDYTRAHGEDRLSWEPKPGVRIATVVHRLKASDSGFVLVGRNMREVEMRELRLLIEVAIAGAAILIASLFATIIFVKNPNKA